VLLTAGSQRKVGSAVRLEDVFGPRCRLPLANIKLAAEQRLGLNVAWRAKRQVGPELAVANPSFVQLS